MRVAKVFEEVASLVDANDRESRLVVKAESVGVECSLLWRDSPGLDALLDPGPREDCLVGDGTTEPVPP